MERVSDEAKERTHIEPVEWSAEAIVGREKETQRENVIFLFGFVTTK